MDVALVLTQPDKPAGRGKKIASSSVKKLAQKLGVRVLSPESLKRDPEAVGALEKLGADVFVVVAYGKLLPAGVLNIPGLGVVNVHPSLLPRYRGPSPMQWAILDGETRSGVSIMLLDEGMDTGPILAREEIVLDAQETYASLEVKSADVGSRLLIETLKRYARGKIVPEAQDPRDATSTRLLEREDGHADWSLSMNVLERKLRAFSVWPGLWSIWRRTDGTQMRLKFSKALPAAVFDDVAPGTARIVQDRLFVKAADGSLEILELQPEGKPIMSARAFIAGHRDIHGANLAEWAF